MFTAIIPARSGSKRIKNKNIKKFLGRPIIYYSIRAAIKSKLFNNLNKIEQHKLVYKSLKGKMGNELHALSLITEGV